MSFIVKDRVRETSTTSGTGTLTLSGAVLGFQTFATIGDGNTTYYCIVDTVTGDWEVGLGTYTASGTTLSRDTVISNSLGTTAKINFAADIKDVFCTYPAEKAVISDGLTSTRIAYANADGQLIDSASLTFNGTTLATTTADLTNIEVTNIKAKDGTSAASIADSTGKITISTELSVDNLNLSGNTLSSTNTNGNITFTANGTGYYIYSGTQAVLVPKGNNSTERPGTPVTGMLRYNTTTDEFEGYSGSSASWKSVGGAAISNDTSTTSNLYPAFLGATSGTASTVYTSNAKLLYKPSTGELQASALVASNGIIVNSTTVAADYTIASGYNGASVGPMTVNSGVTVTVSSGQIWLVM